MPVCARHCPRARESSEHRQKPLSSQNVLSNKGTGCGAIWWHCKLKLNLGQKRWPFCVTRNQLEETLSIAKL